MNSSEKTGSATDVSSRPGIILVVDDEPANIQVLGSVLGAHGHEIIPATNGATALRRLAIKQPDLILLDLLMPEMDGCEVCRRVMENPDWKDIPVIFLSAADDKTLIVRALEAGGVDYVTKPFNQSELVSRVHTQLILKSARDQLKQLAEDKDELLGILAHDLKNHLAGMQMSASLLRDRLKDTGKVDDRGIQLADNLVHTSDSLLTFVKSFLANSAADHRITIEPGPVNLGELTANVIRQQSESALRKEITVHFRPPREPVNVVADSTALNQVLQNLISNAIKFSNSGKNIFVEIKSDETHARVRVQDEGPGFSEEDKTRMFQRYARLSARPTGGEPSTGLGLSIARKLVLAMNGDLTAENIAGEGACFIVRLGRTPTT